MTLSWWGRFGIGCVCVAWLGVGLSAEGDVIGQTWTIPLTPTDFSTSLIFNQFNPASGTLNNVSVVITGIVQAVGDATNTDAGAGTTATIMADATLTLTFPDLSTASANPTLGESRTLGPFGSGTETTTFNVTGTTTTSSPVSGLPGFIGTGTVTIPVDVSGISGVSFDNGSGDFTSDTFAGATGIILVYDFTPFGPEGGGGGGGGGGEVSGVPEPDGLIVWGVAGGVALLAWSRRFRRRSALPAS